ncbi:LytTR family DNA-binding domain-containing protein [Sporosarcina beigongshangi]|uniref:LytTR family DNA-binding domain-containing protein n=1 Tax=Sporosarcina beigongshangi TaxID=2782538 RepID=UPI001939D5A1|nr:LytTR family DNA-binding domain-containing protein [Sporosarcina beigongshangi]
MTIIRLTINESEKYDDAEIIINCSQIDSQLARIIKQIHQISITLIGTREGRTYSLLVDDVYYIETIDNQTFIYTEKEVYACDLKLYEIEQKLSKTHFIRISKNLIVNTVHIESVRALFNGKFEASLTNDEKVIVNRHYVKAFKEQFLS